MDEFKMNIIKDEYTPGETTQMILDVHRLSNYLVQYYIESYECDSNVGQLQATARDIIFTLVEWLKPDDRKEMLEEIKELI
jgi:hypothetical protein